MPTVTVVFTTLARSIAGTDQLKLELPEDATYRDIVRQLAARYPDFLGLLIAEDRETFLSSNMFIIDGDLATPAIVMESKPKDGEVIHLMSVITGG